MPYYVYIIESLRDGAYYKGSSENPRKRIEQHNNGESVYTSGKGPWKLVYVEEQPTKREMLIREKKLKHGNASYFSELIASSKNIVEKFR